MVTNIDGACIRRHRNTTGVDLKGSANLLNTVIRTLIPFLGTAFQRLREARSSAAIWGPRRDTRAAKPENIWQ